MKKILILFVGIAIVGPAQHADACSSSGGSSGGGGGAPRVIQGGGEFGGARHGSQLVMNEPINRIASRAEAEGLQVTYVSDTVIRLTDARGSSITVEGLPAADMEGGRHPSGSHSIMLNRVVRQNIFRQARPRLDARTEAAVAIGSGDAFYENMPHVGRLKAGTADVIYNKWEIGEAEGSTFGINPSATWGEEAELTLTMPLHIISPKSGSTQFSVGLDAAYQYPFVGQLDGFSVGVHGYGMGFFGSDSGSMFGGGPFAAWNYQLHSDWIVSLGCLLELTKPDEGDSYVEIVPGINVGYNMTDALALNVYAIHYKNLDSDFVNDSYTDVGTDVSWMMGAWALNSGFRVSTGLDEAEAWEVFLGSSWIF